MEDSEGYSRALADEELAALIAAGMIEGDLGEVINIEDDEAERDAFFASLSVTPAPEPGSACPSPDEEKAKAGSSRHDGS